MGDIVVNKWSPDSCQCIVNYEWERDSHEDERIHTFNGADKLCEDHKHLEEKEAYEAVLEENQRKNFLLQHAIDSLPHKLARQIVNKDKSVTNILGDGIEYNYFFEGIAPNRILNVSFSEPLTDEEKRVIESRYPGRVKVS